MVNRLLLSLIAIMFGCTYAMADTDISNINNILYYAPITINAGETKDLSIRMKDNGEVQSIGFEFTIPDGMVVPRDEDGLMINLSTERTSYKRHGLSSNYIERAKLYKVAVLQTSGYPFKGTDGEVMTITISVSKDMKPGNYTLRMADIELSGLPKEGQEVPGTISRHGVFEGTITVTDPTGVTNVGEDNNNGIEEIYTIDGIKTEKIQKGFNLIKQRNGNIIKVAK